VFSVEWIGGPGERRPVNCVETELRMIMHHGKKLFTSESVSMGHPDKLADQISDGILDALLEKDPMSRVACETLVTTGLAVIAGEITTKAQIQYADVVRKVIEDVGYTNSDWGISAAHCAVMVTLDRQSPDIAAKVDSSGDTGDEGAGDQGLMFGYACNETPELMPAPIQYSHALINKLTELRKNGTIKWLRPDAKSQVTVEYDGFNPVRVHTVVISTQHDPDVSNEEIRNTLKEKVVKAVIPAHLLDANTIIHINPTGRFVVGGPQGDCGLTGRKIIVDTYGGMGRHGGGAFSGKDPTKVDRSACYMARHIAKNIVAAGLADRCEVQLAYVIGLANPVSVLVDTFGTAQDGIEDSLLADAVRKIFPLTPTGIINYLKLRQPMFRKTAAGGHFGRTGFPWEETNRINDLLKHFGVKQVA
jgi:S-adenosylmethionine synthetase